MNENLKDLFARLAAPFHPSDLEWRAGATNSEKSKALALAYITSRAVMDRLDEVVGPQNWRDEYKPGPDGGVVCGLSLRISDEWITKWDGANNTEFEAIKGGLSDAFKRAGYKWGIGRYLYRLESAWVPCELRGKTIVLKSTPALPDWALPNEWVSASGSGVSKPEVEVKKSTSDREREILASLGFGEAPQREPVTMATAPVTAPKSNGGNGNGAKRAASWSVPVVEAVIAAGLATNPGEAVRKLNEAGLPQQTTPEQAVARLRNG